MRSEAAVPMVTAAQPAVAGPAPNNEEEAMRSEAPMPMAHAAQPAVASPADKADLPPSSEFEVQGKAARPGATRTLELHNVHPRDPKAEMDELQRIRKCAVDRMGRVEIWGDVTLERRRGQCTVAFPSKAAATRARRTLAAHGVISTFFGDTIEERGAQNTRGRRSGATIK